MPHASALPYSTQTLPSLNETDISWVSHERPKTWACSEIKRQLGTGEMAQQGKVLATQI